MSSGSFKNVIYKMCLEIIYLIYMYKNDLVLNNLQWFIYHKTKPITFGGGNLMFRPKKLYSNEKSVQKVYYFHPRLFEPSPIQSL